MVLVRSVDEDEREEVSCTVVAEESTHATSASSLAEDDEASVTSDHDAVNEQPDSHIATSSPDDVKPPTMSEVCESQHLSKPSVSSAGITEAESLQVTCKSVDGHSPRGLVAFCQSDTSAFTSVTTKKHVSSPVIVQGCDQRLRAACTARTSQSFARYRASSACANYCNTSIPRAGYSASDYEEPTAFWRSRLSDSDGDSAEQSYGSDEPVQSYTDSQPSEYDVASSYGHNSSSLSAADERLLEDQSAYAPDCCNETLAAPYPSCIPAQVPCLPPHPQYYHSPVPGMTYPYPAPMHSYLPSMMPYYPPGISVIQHYPFPSYQMMPPAGMMSPVGMVPTPYQPFPAPAPAPAPYWVPPSVMCRPLPMPLPEPMPPLFPQ